MKFIDYGGETVALLLATPNWAQSLEVSMTLPTAIDKAISARESRRAFATSMRYSLGYTVDFFSTRQATDLRLWLNRLKGETVAVPLWTDAVEISVTANAGSDTFAKTATMPVRYGSEWIVLSDDLSAYEIVVVSAIDAGTVTLVDALAMTWPAGTLLFPLLFGKLAERPQFDAVTDEALSGAIKIQENSPFARRLNPTAVTLPTVGGGVPAFSTAKLFAATPQWSRVLDRSEADVLYQALGFLRQEQQYVYQQPVRRGLEMEFDCYTRADMTAIERLFSDRRGTTRPFLVPTHRGDLRITQDLPIAGNATRITIEQPSRYSDPDYGDHPGAPYLALIDANGAIDARKITVVSGGDLTTAVAITAPHKKDETKLSHLLLVRFADAKLSWTYTSDEIAMTRLKFIEVPDEYVTPNADLPEPIYLYRFEERTPTPQNSYFTSYEDSFSYGGHTYAPAPFSHASIASNINLAREEVQLTSWGGNFPSNPLAKLFPYELEGELWVSISEADKNNPSASPDFLLSGTVTKPNLSGLDWKVTVRRFGNLLEKNANNCYYQKVCNVPLYSPKCGVNRNTYKVSGTYFAGSAPKIIEVALVADDPDVARPDHYFAGGMITTGSGSGYESRTILESVNVSGPRQRLTLDRPLRLVVAGQTVNMFPGCNGAIETCALKFNNLVNFRGFPYIPIKNPSADIGALSANAGGKKG